MSSRIGASKWRVHDPSGVTYILPRERGRRRQALPLAPIQLQTKGGYVPRRIGRERIGRLSLGRLATVGTDGCKEAVTSSKCNSRFARSKAASNLVFLDILSARARSANSPTFIAILSFLGWGPTRRIPRKGRMLSPWRLNVTRRSRTADELVASLEASACLRQVDATCS